MFKNLLAKREASKLIEILDNTDWSHLDKCCTTDTYYNNLEQTLSDIIEKITPKRTTTIKVDHYIVNPKLHTLSRRKKLYYRRWKLRKTNEDYLAFKRESTKQHFQLKKLRTDNIRRMIKPKSPRDLWKAVNYAKGKRRTSIPILDYGNETAKTDTEKANLIRKVLLEMTDSKLMRNVF